RTPDGQRNNGQLAQPSAARSLLILTRNAVVLRAVGPSSLGRYVDLEGEFHKLDVPGWELIRREMSAEDWAVVRLYDAGPAEYRYRFEYHGRQRAGLSGNPSAAVVSEVKGWLPTEWLEAQGPARVREWALDLAASLPFCSGQVGLSINGGLDLAGVKREALQRCLRHPGIDVPDESIGGRLGTRLWGVSWLTFVGQPVLGELGGVNGLKARLHAPGVSVQDLDGARAVVTLGEWPEAGNVDAGQVLPAYRELARVLEPWLYQEPQTAGPSFSLQQQRDWARRFLD
ncbi:Protein of unknown function, partial [Stigmatella aurantiaca]